MPSGKAGSFMNGRKLVYVKLSQMTKTGKRTVCVGDIGQVYCSDPAAAAKVKAIRAASFPKAVRRTAVCGDIMELIRLAQEADPQIQIVNLGETEYAVLFEPAPEGSVVLQGAKTAFVALVAFCGAAFAIMTFNNDANVTDVFGTLYRLIAGRDAAGPTVLDASYSVGLAAGILLFFNHFASWKITEDPTPIEVEMSLYEENLNKTIIQNGERKGADPDGV